MSFGVISTAQLRKIVRKCVLVYGHHPAKRNTNYLQPINKYCFMFSDFTIYQFKNKIQFCTFTERVLYMKYLYKRGVIKPIVLIYLIAEKIIIIVNLWCHNSTIIVSQSFISRSILIRSSIAVFKLTRRKQSSIQEFYEYLTNWI